MGVGEVSAEDCITSASAAAHYLAMHHPEVKRAYIVGGSGLSTELRLSGIEPVGEGDVGGLDALLASGGLEASLPIDAVVAGQQVEELGYMRLAKAAAYARDRSRPFIGTNIDCNYPAGASELLPAGGCIIRYLAYAAEREPCATVGKPSRDLAELVAAKYGLQPSTTLMVGDRCNTDIAFGHSVSWRTMLVLSGCHTRADAEQAPPDEMPEYVAASVADLRALCS